MLTAELFSPGSLKGVWVGFPFIGSWGQVGVGRQLRIGFGNRVSQESCSKAPWRATHLVSAHPQE